MSYSIFEQNCAHFKFLSQHFHKSIALVTGTPELKGTKAHNRFLRLCEFSFGLVEHLSFDEFFYWFKSHDRRETGFTKLTQNNIRKVYKDLYPEMDIKELLSVYYDFFYFTHHKDRPIKMSLASLKELKSFTFSPQHPDYNVDHTADYLAVAFEGFSALIANSSNAKINRDLLNSVMMLYFSFFDKGLIVDFNMQDVADLTNPYFYHDAFIKYKLDLDPIYQFESKATHCYDKIAYYTDSDYQLRAHNTLCNFLSTILKKDILPEKDRNKILFYRVFESLYVENSSKPMLKSSIEVAKNRPQPTIDDFDFSKVKPVNVPDVGLGEQLS